MSEENKSPRPGEAALQNMKLLKTESTLFKVPKVPKKTPTLKKAQVLDEDVYVEGIAKIIQRDFFPDLEKLNAQNEYLEASENKDYARVREITQKYSGGRPLTEPYNSPATFDTPEIGRPYSPSAPTVREQRPETAESVQEKTKDITDNHSLDSFLATHTSEDNASYDRIISLEDKKRATKLAAQFEAERTSLALADAALVLPSIEEQADQTKRPEELDTWRYTARNYIMYVPAGCGATRPARGELRRHNTRLRAPPFDPSRSQRAISQLAKTQGANVSGKIGVDGVSVSAESGEGERGAEYSLVAAPSPAPGAGPDASPMMTWGHIEGTPFRLDGGDTPLPHVGAGAAYRMLEGGARERIALQLAEQAAKKRRPATPRLLTPEPNFRTNTERLASMSPAARRLATKHLLSPRLKLTPNDMGIFHTATPKRTPTPQRKLIATPKKSATPSRAGSVNNSANMTENSSVTSANLTDNLLQINVAKRTRLKAQDFF